MEGKRRGAAAACASGTSYLPWIGNAGLRAREHGVLCRPVLLPHQRRRLLGLSGGCRSSFCRTGRARGRCSGRTTSRCRRSRSSLSIIARSAPRRTRSSPTRAAWGSGGAIWRPPVRAGGGRGSRRRPRSWRGCGRVPRANGWRTSQTPRRRGPVSRRARSPVASRRSAPSTAITTSQARWPSPHRMLGGARATDRSWSMSRAAESVERRSCACGARRRGARRSSRRSRSTSSSGHRARP